MIKLSSKSYLIRNMEPNVFWQKLDAITFGQKLNPELGYTVPFEGSFHNVFAGRKVGNTFSLYRYQPRSKPLRTEILAKGEVIQTGNHLDINVRYEIPLWSCLAFLFLGTIIMTIVWVGQHPGIAKLLTGLIVFIYVLVIRSNHNSIRKTIEQQFLKFEGYR